MERVAVCYTEVREPSEPKWLIYLDFRPIIS